MFQYGQGKNKPFVFLCTSIYGGFNYCECLLWMLLSNDEFMREKNTITERRRHNEERARESFMSYIGKFDIHMLICSWL